MRIWCLTSLTKRDFESYLKQNQFNYFGEKIESDLETLTRQNQYNHYIQKLEGCEKYVFTEIFVGKNGSNFEFHVHREDFGVLRYFMKPDTLKYTKVSKTVLDVEVSPNNGFGLPVFVKNIRIRCIKSDSSRTLTTEQKKYFDNYAKKIEEYANGDSERREAAFSASEIEKFEYEAEEEYNSRMSDLINAFNGLCVEEEKRVSARYNQFIDRNIFINYHNENDKRINYIKDFTKTKEIKLFRCCAPTYINPKWFDAINLEILNLSCVSPFEFEGSWKVFGNGIQNCQRLRKLTLHKCGITDIPDFVYEALPLSIQTLSVAENNLKRLSSLISKLTNLESLSISHNPDLNDDGMPWDDLPEKLLMLDLAGTNVKIIPAKIKRLKLLEFLYCGNQVTYVKWNCLPIGLEQLSVECGGRINSPRSFRRFKKLGSFMLTNAGLKRRFFKHLKSLYRIVDLSGNNFTMFKCPNFSPDVTRLYLNSCKLTSVEWVDVWRVLTSLEQLQLRHNQLTQVFPYPFCFYEYSVLTHLDLEDNQIQSVCGEFLPTSLTYLDLSHNKITSFIEIDYLPHLSALFIEYNQLDKLPEGIEKCWNLKALVASNNQISALPEGFENLPYLVHLNLSSNKFNNDEDSEGNLVTSLWNRLPQKVDVVMLSYNILGELPCQLSKKEIRRLEVDKCKLRHICPRLGSTPFPRATENYISIKLNEELENLSFVPSKIFIPPTTYDQRSTEQNNAKGKMILTSDKSFKDTSRWQTIHKIHTYDFILKPHDPEYHLCRCCARCGKDCSAENGRIETFMVMDFTLVVETPPDETLTEKDVIDEYGPGEWKTLVKTKMCSECIAQMREEVAKFYDETPLKRKTTNTKKNTQTKNVVNIPLNAEKMSFASFPKNDNSRGTINFNGTQAQESNTSLFSHNQYVTPSQGPLEEFVQMDDTVLYMEHQQPQQFAYPYVSYSVPGPSSDYLSNNIPTDYYYYNIANEQSYNATNARMLPPNPQQLFTSDIEMQDIYQDLVFTTNMDDDEFQNKAKKL